jgi:hypothetical protein
MVLRHNQFGPVLEQIFYFVEGAAQDHSRRRSTGLPESAVPPPEGIVRRCGGAIVPLPALPIAD